MEPTLSFTPALQAVSAALVAARRTGVAADERALPDTPLTADEAYAVQEHVASELGWTSGADAPSHWKGGGPGVGSTAVFARLPPPWVQPSPGEFAARDFHRKGIEIEVAFRLARDITAVDLAARSAHDPAAFIDAMAVSIELVDFRWQGCDRAPASLRMADLQCNGALVVGDWVPLRPVDWSQQIATLEVDGAQVDRYQGAHPAGDPLWFATQWLAHGVARHDRLAAGSVLTTGSWCGMVWLDGPADVRAVFDGIGEATLQLV